MITVTALQKIGAIEAAIAEIHERLDHVERVVADRAPANVIERRNHAFELMADRNPASEIERLNHPFEWIAMIELQHESKTT